MSWRPLNGWGSDLASRRIELFKLAAPVFRRHGYRGATVKALAHACHLSPSALYHWFPSKAALATCLLDRPRLDWDAWRLDPAVAPLAQLVALIDLSIQEMPDYLLSIDLARELGRPLETTELAGVFAEGETLFAKLLLAAAPDQGEASARELARRLIAILVAPHTTGLDPAPEAVRARAIDLLRLHLPSAGFDSVSLDRAAAGG